MLCTTRSLVRIVLLISLAGISIQTSRAAEETVLKAKLNKPHVVRQGWENRLFTTLFDHSAVYEHLLNNYDFIKLQDMAIRLWDRHTNVRRYRYSMKDDFIQRETTNN